MYKKLICLACFVLVLGLAGSSWAALPEGWSSQDAGAVGAAGSASESDGTWTVTGNGADIWDTTDRMHFAFIPLAGSGQMVARVVSIGDGSNNWAKGGVMIRETLDAGSANSCTMVTPSSGGGLTFQIRPTAGASSTSQHTQAPNVVPPYWVKIVREGDEFSGWRSTDGVTWTQQGTTQTVPMAKDVYVGLCVTSHTDGELRTFTFDNVSVELAKIALGPIPADGEVIPETWTAFAWSPGDGAVSHDVYIGEDFNDVTAGTGDTFVGNQAEASSIVGVTGYPYPDGLVLGATYYWRVDEVEADDTKHTGRVWSFSLPSAKAQDPVPADAVAYVDPATTLSWTEGFRAALHHVYLSENAADVEAGAPAAYKGPSPNTTYDPGPLENGKTYYWRVDEFDTSSVTHTGDVWSFSTMPDIPIRDPNLVGWWKLDDVGSGNVIDFSGYGHHGTLHGDAQFVPGGYDGDAMQFDGEGWVNMDGFKGVLRIAADNQKAFTCAAWIKCTNDNGTIMGWGQPSGKQRVEFRINGQRLRVEHGSGNKRGDTNVDNDQWRHVVLVVPEGSDIDRSYFYLDGQPEPHREVADGDPFSITANFDVQLARRYNDVTDRDYTGQMDDVRLYDKVLTQEEIQFIILRPEPLRAWAESPADGSTPDLLSAESLGWSAGEEAAEHGVYLGTDAQAVADADASDATGIYKGRQAGTSYTPAAAFEPTQTYYWRIDEHNTDGSIIKGLVWSFTAGNFILVDDAEDYDLGNNEIWWAWRDGIGFGAPDVPPSSPGNGTGSAIGDETTGSYTEESIVNSGSQSIPYWFNNNKADKAKYSEAKKTLTSARDWTLLGVKALTLSFRGFGPSVGSFTEDPAGTYTMTAAGADIWNNTGLVAGNHDEFHFAYKQLTGAGLIVAKVERVLNTNGWAKACVMIRDTLDPDSAHGMMCVTPASGVSFQRRPVAGEASAGTTQAGIPAPQWVKIERDLGGNITASYSADGTTWTQQGTELITMTPPVYIGLALTGHDNSETCEAVFSNVTITGQVGQVWTSQDIGVNDAEPMYVAVANNTGAPAVVYYEDPDDPDAIATQIRNWTEWNIDLKEFSDQGINLADVNSIAIGFGDRDNPVAGGTGKMFFDDIRLYIPRCVASLAQPAGDLNDDCAVDIADMEIISNDWLVSGYDVTVTAASDANLEAHYELDGNLLDSSVNGYDGDPCGTIAYVAGKSGHAVEFLGATGGSFVNVPGYFGVVGTQSRTCSAWIRTHLTGEIVSWGQNSAGQKWVFRVQESNGVIGAIRVEVNGGYAVGTTDVRDDEWHHVAAVLVDDGTPNATEIALYVDGVREVVSALLDEPINTATDGVVRIGEAPWHTRPFTGQIDDVRIYSRALPPGEVANLAGINVGEALYVPVQVLLSTSADADLNDDEAIDFKDFAALAAQWLEEQLWPTE